MNQAAGPGVRFPPPLLFVAGYGIGLLLHSRIPLPLAGTGAMALWRALGWVVIAGGLVLALSAVATFRRARTSMIPNRPATVLVTSGPYRFSRNPMYVSLILLYTGAALLANTWWPLALLPLVLLALYRSVIVREERYLAEAFAETYAQYRSRVRRWL